MKSASPTPLLNPHATPVSDWNWREELATLESNLDHVAEGARWDWRRDLRALEAELDQLAARVGQKK